MYSIIESVQFTQVIFMLYLFYAIIDLKSTKREIFIFWILLFLFMSLKLWLVENILQVSPWSHIMELLWWIYNSSIYLYFFIYLRNNYVKNKRNPRV